MLLLASALTLAGDGLAVEATFPICGDGRRVTCVVDGDTFWHNRIKYRLADIDAPEVSNPKCEAEAKLGRSATYRLAAQLNAGRFELQEQGTDRYGRTLATVTRGGRSIGRQLVSEGLARRWGDRRGWC
ncbi:thermonuclease family protein [Erythrobacter sp. sf7]|uniref:Thermonuclease family protein n=1 Tax=Erythrobacter fulvus TaxID=2987523 RepID=A0ABT5JRG6_9SPHN|nr:thermonuclease family protein [Erythrobacter fulvus]MDC8755194.1 thermonuclease family protein [Erythrobacter fulvus]